MSSYIFPFNTCEAPKQNSVAQPYSAFFNLLNSLIVFYFMVNAHSKKSFLLILSLFLFETYHTFSHSVHIPGKIQINITHFLAYIINFSLLYFFKEYSNNLPNNNFLVFYVFLIFFDIYAFNNLNIVFYLFSQALLFLSVLIYYYDVLPDEFKNYIPFIFIIITSIILLFINEIYNCEKLIKKYPKIPFHVGIEILGLILFYLICKNFYIL